MHPYPLHPYPSPPQESFMMVDIGGDDTGLRDNLSLLRPIRVNRSRFPNGAELPMHHDPGP